MFTRARLYVLCVFALIFAGCAAPPAATSASGQAAAATAATDRVVVLISVDGLAGFYFDDPKAEMPNIRRLAEQGASARTMKASNPTVTWPNHTTLVTGAHPARHGVVGNNYFDRAKRERVTLVGDPVFDKDQIVKVPTIYDIAHAHGLTTASVYWPATRNASTLTWTIPEVRKHAQLDQYTTPSLRAELVEAGIPLERTLSAGKGQPVSNEERDEIHTQAFQLILSKHRPRLALLHLVRVDHDQHRYGPRTPQAYAAIAHSDELVGRVWDQLQREFPGKATLLVVSDHGVSPIEREIRPNIILRDAGLLEDPRAIHVVVQGGSAMIYVLDESNRASILARIRKAFEGQEGIDTIAGPGELSAFGVAEPNVDPHAPDLMLFAKEGYVFGDTASGELPFVEKPERGGSHGHSASLPSLHAMFVAWGSGIRAGAALGDIENTSVAPTIARLLNLPMPDADGKPLIAALSE